MDAFGCGFLGDGFGEFGFGGGHIDYYGAGFGLVDDAGWAEEDGLDVWREADDGEGDIGLSGDLAGGVAVGGSFGDEVAGFGWCAVVDVEGVVGLE